MIGTTPLITSALHEYFFAALDFNDDKSWGKPFIG
jgi:hypothetical protein